MTREQVSPRMVAMPRRRSFSDQIRKAIRESGMTRYAICKEIGLSQSVMSRFCHQQSGLSISTLDRLAEFLDLHVVVGASKGRGK
ncbi:MAG: XRE family transcriptional regulator [Planctomycetota bacterium]|nr:MAG: XRE family transcriptional regulator [Planctomycetota bacterium]